MNKEIEEERRRNGGDMSEGEREEERGFEGEEIDAHEVNKYTGMLYNIC